MGKSKLSVICGMKVTGATLAQGDAGISFENGASLAIYNKFDLVGPASNDQNRLIGNIVARVEESADAISIIFENNLALRIDLREEAYAGPEAMQLCVPGAPIIVWN